MFSGGTERDQWHEMGQLYLSKLNHLKKLYNHWKYKLINSLRLILEAKFGDDPLRTCVRDMSAKLSWSDVRFEIEF